MSDIIQVRVVTNAKKNRIEGVKGGLKVWLTAAPVGGKANKLLLEILATHFGIKKSQLKIIKGQKSKDKSILIEK